MPLAFGARLFLVAGPSQALEGAERHARPQDAAVPVICDKKMSPDVGKGPLGAGLPGKMQDTFLV